MLAVQARGNGGNRVATRGGVKWEGISGSYGCDRVQVLHAANVPDFPHARTHV